MKLRPQYESVRSFLLNCSLIHSLDVYFGELFCEEYHSTQITLKQSHGSSGLGLVAYATQSQEPPMPSNNLQYFCYK